MDGQKPVIGEHQHDYLKHVPGPIRPDGQLLRRVVVHFEVDDDERMICGVTDGEIADAVPPGRTMDFHTALV